MVRTNPDGRTDALMHTHTPNVVTTMSRVPTSGLDKNYPFNPFLFGALATITLPLSH